MHELVVGENRSGTPTFTVKKFKIMQFEEFQHLARLSIIGKLDPDELEQFEAGRREFGARAEACINECRKLETLLALSLCPCEPDPMTKEKLFAKIRQSAPPVSGQPSEPVHPQAIAI